MVRNSKRGFSNQVVQESRLSVYYLLSRIHLISHIFPIMVLMLFFFFWRGGTKDESSLTSALNGHDLLL
jgi:hypothetical protein